MIRTTAAMTICSLCGDLGDMKREDQASSEKVLAVLAAMPVKRFSVFEVADNMVIARTMARIVQDGLIKTDNSCGYPWTEYIITRKGRTLAALVEKPQ